MTGINEIQDRIIEEVSALDGRAGLYQYLIKLGREGKALPEEFRKDRNLISGCQSKLWLASEFKSGKVIYYADSDAVITRGILKLLLRVLNRRKPEDIVGADLYFLEKTGLSEHLSPVRSSGLAQLLVHIRKHAGRYR